MIDTYDYYEVLGVPRSSTADEIKTQYQMLVKRWHPDKNQQIDQAYATERFKAIKEAYETLFDPEKRRAYDMRDHYSGHRNDAEASSGTDDGFDNSSSSSKRDDRTYDERYNRKVNAPYLIEFRFSGHAKHVIKELKENISKKFGISKHKIVPHITLVGPLSTRDEWSLISEVGRIGRKYELVNFKLDGFGKFDGMEEKEKKKVIYVNIKPSEELETLRLDLAKSLGEFCNLSKFDNRDKFDFHATIIIMKTMWRKFDYIWEYLQSWKVPGMDQYVIRITILKNKKILREYDLLQRRMLTRREALDKKIYQKTVSLLEKKRERPERRFEDIPDSAEIFVCSDMHFDHANIIKYCNRPFRHVVDMNRRLVENWNDAVGRHERVFFLGDMCYGRGRRPIDEWLGRLNGDIRFIRGNHDTDRITRADVVQNHYGIAYKGYRFLLMHDPHRPPDYDGWLIHGDKHNNHPREYPLIHQKNKTINACAEMTGYAPIGLDRIITLIETGRTYKTING